MSQAIALSRVARANHVLSVFSDADRSELEALFEPVELPRDRVLFEPGDHIAQVYFPITCVVSILQPYASGDVVETSTVGCEGFVCLSAALGGERTFLRHLVQIGGEARRIQRVQLVAILERHAALRARVQRFSRQFLNTALLSVACNRMHAVEQRLARWLLMTRERTASDRLPLTHDILSEMLGVYRPTVTRAVRELRKIGLIETSPGEITILDRPGLEAHSCECFQIERDQS